MSQVFTPSQFVATQWASPEDKAAWANHLVRFINSGFKKSLFQKKFYDRLSGMFGHIAHYNRDGFYDEWFSSPDRQADFVRNLLAQGGYGDPTWTWSDVEKAVKEYLRKG